MYRYVALAIHSPNHHHQLTEVALSGGKICLTIHFQPLWNRNVPRFGIAHALALGVRLRAVPIPSVSFLSNVPCHSNWHLQLAPWLAAEVPDLVQRGVIVHK